MTFQSETKLYRVICKTTSSLQPSVTTWNSEVLYVGDDLRAARIAFHGSEPFDEHRGYGNRCRQTVWQVLDNAPEHGPGEFTDQEAPPQ